MVFAEIQPCFAIKLSQTARKSKVPINYRFELIFYQNFKLEFVTQRTHKQAINLKFYKGHSYEMLHTCSKEMSKPSFSRFYRKKIQGT